MEAYLRDNIDQAEALFPLRGYHILVAQRGAAQKSTVARHIETWGGTVGPLSPNGYIFHATLTPQQLLSLVQLNEVLYVSRRFPPVRPWTRFRIAVAQARWGR